MISDRAEQGLKRPDATRDRPILPLGDPAVTDHPTLNEPARETNPTASSAVTPRLPQGTTIATAATVAATSWSAPFVHAAGSDTIKVGLVGCGGRGTGAAEQALTADSGTRLVAIADAFQDRIDDHLPTLKGSKVGGRVDVPKDRQYAGFDAYKHVIDQVDLVLLTTPPHFRPIHLAYAVEKGIHAFVEKPMAVDGPGLRKFLQAAKDARTKNLSLVNGFCWRYDHPRRETMKQVFDGKIGDIVAIETTYNSQGVWEPRKTREECASDMEYQMRNWYYYCWLSGDHIVEQAVHGIDTMAWATGDKPPIRCWAVGGRQSAHRSPSTATSGTTSRSSTSTPTTSAAITTAGTGSTRRTRSRTTSSAARARPTSSATRSPARTSGAIAARSASPTCTRSSTTRCSPRSAPASRSTTASRPPTALSWPSWAARPPTPARSSRRRRSSTRRKT